MEKQLIRLAGMIIVGLSAISLKYIGMWFLVPWVIGWIVYDLNFKYEKNN